MYLPGFALFCAVEGIYALYLKPDRRVLVIRAGWFAVLLLVGWILRMLTLANAFGLLNLSLLSVNVVEAWRARKSDSRRTALLFAAGLTCFLAGDLSVAAEVLTVPGSAIHTVASLAVWTFYLPAEVLIVLTYDGRIRPGEREA